MKKIKNKSEAESNHTSGNKFGYPRLTHKRLDLVQYIYSNLPECEVWQRCIDVSLDAIFFQTNEWVDWLADGLAEWVMVRNLGTFVRNSCACVCAAPARLIPGRLMGFGYLLISGARKFLQ